MLIELRWIASASASCFHAAQAIACGQTLADAELATALAQPTAELTTRIELAGLPAELLWQNLAALAGSIENNRQLAERALIKTIRQGARQQQLTGDFNRDICGLENAFNQARPDALEQLELRGTPLRELWEARGPGMLHQVTLSTGADFLVERADVLLVLPALGGGGAAHVAYNSVRIEAVLANPWPQLPEVVRLAWLLSQLNLDLPTFQGELRRDRVEHVGRLALIPLVLAAGEGVELTRCDPATVQLALSAWRLCRTEDEAGSTSATLLQWWEVYRESRPSWPAALGALDRMLCAVPADGNEE